MSNPNGVVIAAAPLTFERWMSEVGQIVASKVFLSTNDLIDCPYRDWFDSGIVPIEAARMTLEENGFSDGDDDYEGEEGDYNDEERPEDWAY